MAIYHEGYVIDGNSMLLGYFTGRASDLIEDESDTLAPGEILGHVVVKAFYFCGGCSRFFHLVKFLTKC